MLRELGISFKVELIETDESYPEDLKCEEIPVFIARQKAKPFDGKLAGNDLLITVDTIVWLDGEVFGKPANEHEAIRILEKLSNNEHQVISGVCLTSAQKQKAFYAISKVTFKKLSEGEIRFYVEK